MSIEQDEKLLHTELVKAIRRMRRVKLSVMADQVIYSEYVALIHISRYVEENPGSTGIYVSELAKRMEIAPSSASRMLNSIEGKGLITRTVNVKDRRNTYVCLTPAGRKVLEDSAREMDELWKRLLRRMGNEDAHRLIELWNKMAGIMEEEVGAGPEHQKEGCGKIPREKESIEREAQV